MAPTDTELRILLMDIFTSKELLRTFLGDESLDAQILDIVGWDNVAKEQYFEGVARELESQGLINIDLCHKLRENRPEKRAAIDHVFGVAMPEDEYENAKNLLRIKVSGNTVTAKTCDWSAEWPFVVDDLQREAIQVLRQLIGEGRYGDKDASKLVGKILYEALFPKLTQDGLTQDGEEIGSPSKRYLNEREKSSSTSPLLVRLEFDDSDVDDLPWEHLYGGRRFLSKDSRVILSRFKVAPGSPRAPSEDPLKVLFVTCNPPEVVDKMIEEQGMRSQRPGLEYFDFSVPEDLGRVLDAMPAELSKEILGLKEPQSLEGPATGLAVKKMLEDMRPDVVHYIGHGRIINKQPAIALIEDDESLAWTDSEEFTELFADYPPRLVVLHLHQGELAGLKAGFETFAPELLEQGVDAVVATQFPVSRKKAKVFMLSLYRNLCNGESVDAAVQEARAKIYNTSGEPDDRFYGVFASPLLYLRSHEQLRLVNPTKSTKQGPPSGIDDSTSGQRMGSVSISLTGPTRDTLEKESRPSERSSSRDDQHATRGLPPNQGDHDT